MTLTIVKNHKTLSEWFADLDLEQKLSIYRWLNQKPIILEDIFEPEESRDSQVDGTE